MCVEDWGYSSCFGEEKIGDNLGLGGGDDVTKELGVKW